MLLRKATSKPKPPTPPPEVAEQIPLPDDRVETEADKNYKIEVASLLGRVEYNEEQQINQKKLAAELE